MSTGTSTPLSTQTTPTGTAATRVQTGGRTSAAHAGRSGDLFRLDGQTVVLTGASSGIGRHVAAELVRAGATVVAAARRQHALNDLRDELGDAVVPVPCDITDPSARASLIAHTISTTGRLDVLVNNAGAATTKPALAGDVGHFDATLQLNLTSSFALSAAAAAHMIDNGGGSIVNVASILGIVAAAPIEHVAYCAAKGAILAMTRQLACEWAGSGVRVNALAPGWFPSELTDDMFADERSQGWLRRNTPMRRPGRLTELDGPLLLLCSQAGSFITGQTLVVDGGWTAR